MINIFASSSWVEEDIALIVTRFPAEIAIFGETLGEARVPLSGFFGREKLIVALRPGDSKEIVLLY